MNPDVSERARLFISESDGENGLKMGRNMHVLTANLKGKIIDALKSVTRLSNLDRTGFHFEKIAELLDK